MSTKRIQRQTHDTRRNVRVALRVPTEVHSLIRVRAEKERLSVNQAIVRAMEMFSGSPSTEIRQEIRDLVEVCRLLGPEVNQHARRALMERVGCVYGTDLSRAFNGSRSATRGGENAIEMKA